MEQPYQFTKQNSMMVTRFIEVNFQVEGLHRWKEAPPQVAFLRNYHRHIFHFHVKRDVRENNREIEFIMLKRHLEAIVRTEILDRPRDASCEMIAEELVNHCLEISPLKPGQNIEIVVLEDGENAGGVSCMRTMR
jgi:hypothetical protein